MHVSRKRRMTMRPNGSTRRRVQAAAPIALLVLLSAALVQQAKPSERPPKPPAEGGAVDNEITREARTRLLKEFEGLLARPGDLAAKVRKECRIFPEGDLLPYTFPALAYANLALAEPGKYRRLALKRMPQLIDLAMPAVIRRVRPPDGDLTKLKRFNKQAVYLGQLNLALGCYRLIGGDGRYEAIHKHVSGILHDELVLRRGRALDSYPQASRPFDTIPCVVSLHLRDLHTGRPRSREIIAAHLEWVRKHATDPKLHLPYSRLAARAGQPHDVPRGEDLALRISLLAHVDKKYATALYRNFVRAYWRESVLAAGFAAWPQGHKGRQDVYSGPIILEISASASGFGVGATVAMNDTDRCDRLCRQIANGKNLLAMFVRHFPQQAEAKTFGGVIDLESDYYTGFLFGDAALFYSMTYTDWSKPSRPKATAPAGAKEGRAAPQKP